MFVAERKGGRPRRFCGKPCKLRHASAHRWDDRPIKVGPCAVCGAETRQHNGTPLCSDECRSIRQKQMSEAWHKARPEYAATNYQRHKHQWRVWNANRVNRLKAQTSPHTTEAKIEARMAYFGRACWVCGEPGVERDHVKPLSKGGAHLPCNLRPICRHCNRSKKDAWPYEPKARANA